MRGGAPLSWVRPAGADGNAVRGAIGCYRGPFEHWNLKSIKPGFVTRFVHKKKVASRKRMGWVIATPADVEAYGDPEDIEKRKFSDATLETENMVLMMAPIAVADAHRQQIAALSTQGLKKHAADFINRSSASEATYSAQANGRPIREAVDVGKFGNE